jgi:hypothetical protein
MISLKTQKQLAIGAVAVFGIYGLSSLFGHSSSPEKAPTPSPKTVETVNPQDRPRPQQAAPVSVPAQIPTPQPKRDNKDEKAQKLSNLQKADVAWLKANGYTPIERLFPFGRDCNNNGTTDGTGYHGTSTSISYSVTYDDKQGIICIAHGGKGGTKLKPSAFTAQ